MGSRWEPTRNIVESPHVKRAREEAAKARRALAHQAVEHTLGDKVAADRRLEDR